VNYTEFRMHGAMTKITNSGIMKNLKDFMLPQLCSCSHCSSETLWSAYW